MVVEISRSGGGGGWEKGRGGVGDFWVWLDVVGCGWAREGGEGDGWCWGGRRRWVVGGVGSLFGGF